MPLVIDTYNVLQTVGILPPEMAGIDVRGLIGLLQQSRYRNEPVHLICDGHPPSEGAPPRRVGKIGVSYAGAQTADALIDKFIRNASHPKQLTVVSSDNEVLRSARRRRCKILRSDEFLQHLVDDAHRPQKADQPAKPPPPISDKQIERWKSVFGMDDAAAQRELENDARIPDHLRKKRRSGPVIRQTLETQHASSEQSSQSPGSETGESRAEPDEDMSVFPNDVVEEAEELARRLRQQGRSPHNTNDGDNEQHERDHD